TNSGTSVTIPGIISVASTSRKSQVRPQKSILANAYPSIEQNTRLPSVTVTATTTELVKNCMKSSRVNSSWKLSNVGLCGHHVGGLARSSPSVLNAPRNIQTNGVT